MTNLSPYDATILATLAKNVRARGQVDNGSGMVKRLLGKLSDEGRCIGEAIVSTTAYNECTPEVQDTAQAIRRWAATTGRRMSAISTVG